MICIQGPYALMPVKRAPFLIVLFVHTHIMQISLDLSALHILIISFKLFCFSSFFVQNPILIFSGLRLAYHKLSVQGLVAHLSRDLILRNSFLKRVFSR
jgi:hypothetical protein